MGKVNQLDIRLHVGGNKYFWDVTTGEKVTEKEVINKESVVQQQRPGYFQRAALYHVPNKYNSDAKRRSKT